MAASTSMKIGVGSSSLTPMTSMTFSSTLPTTPGGGGAPPPPTSSSPFFAAFAISHAFFFSSFTILAIRSMTMVSTSSSPSSTIYAKSGSFPNTGSRSRTLSTIVS